MSQVGDLLFHEIDLKTCALCCTACVPPAYLIYRPGAR